MNDMEVIQLEYEYNRSSCELLKQIIQMNKHTTLQSKLSELLQKYEAKLEQYNFEGNGLYKIDFGHAAFFLQFAVEIYAKKIDLLWNQVLDFAKKLIMSQRQIDTDKKELQKLEECRQKTGRRKKAVIVETEDSVDFSFGSNNCQNYLNESYDSHHLLDEWNKFDKTVINDTIPKNVMQEHGTLFQPTTRMYSLDEDYLGKYDQLQSSHLVDELQYLNDNNLIEDEQNFILALRIEGQVVYDYFHENRISNKQDREDYVEKLNMYIQKYNDQRQIDTDCEMTIDKLRYDSQNIIKESFVQLEKLSEKIIQEKLRRISDVDSVIGNESFYKSSESQISTDLDEESIKRNLSYSGDSAFFDGDEEMDDIECGVDLKPNSTNNRNTLNISEKTSQRSGKRSDNIKNKKRSRKSLRLSEPESIEKLSKGITTGLRRFERFYSKEYRLTDGEEGSFQATYSDSDTDPEDNVEIPDLQENVEVLEISIANTSNLMESTNVMASTSENSIQTKVNEWHTFMSSKLNKMVQSDFDIHKYESDIIDTMEIGETRTFRSFVNRKNNVEMSRYFMASLQLACSENVEVSGVIPGELSNETLSLKLLNRTRHHEMLNSYQAPSEEIYKRKLSELQLAESLNCKKIRFTYSDR